jgi:hypothetical protein
MLLLLLLGRRRGRLVIAVRVRDAQAAERLRQAQVAIHLWAALAVNERKVAGSEGTTRGASK